MNCVLHNHSSYPVAVASQTASRDAQIAAVIREQEACGVDIVTDGNVGWSDPIARFIDALDGVRHAAAVPHVQQLVVTGALRRQRPILLDDYRIATTTTQRPVKPVLPGPYTLARLAIIEAGPYRDVPMLAHAFCEILTVEVQDLVQAGALIFQIEEPAIVNFPADIRLARRVLEPLWAARGTAEMVVATYGANATASYAELNSLPADMLALDLPSSPGLAELIAATGASKVLALGLIDGRSEPTDAATLARQVEAMLPHYALDALHLLPARGLGLLPRELARATLTLMNRVRQLVHLDA